MRTNIVRRGGALVCFVALAVSISATRATGLAQQRGYDPSLLKGLQWRSIGPFRGGRATAVAGVASQPIVFYFGATGGGVWKTIDGGINWDADLRRVLQDRLGRRDRGRRVRPERRSTSGWAKSASAATSRTATACTSPPTRARRGSTSVSKTRARSRACGCIRRTPTSSTSRRWVTSVGRTNSAASSARRTAARPGRRSSSQRQGRRRRTWCMDPTNPSILYAAFWEVVSQAVDARERRARKRPLQIDRRRRHLDGDLAEPGLAEGTCRARSASPSRRPTPERVWAIVEAEDGGVFRSDDGGENWTRVNDRAQAPPARLVLHAHLRRPEERRHGLRAEHRLLPVQRRRAHATRRIRVPHGDNHDLWIAPDDPNADDRRQRRRRERLVQRRADLVRAGPADGAVLPRRARQRLPLPRLRRAAGQLDRRDRRAARPAGASTVTRLVRRRRRRKRLDRAAARRDSNIVFRGLLRRAAHALRPSHRTAAQRHAWPRTRWAGARRT